MFGSGEPFAYFFLFLYGFYRSVPLADFRRYLRVSYGINAMHGSRLGSSPHSGPRAGTSRACSVGKAENRFRYCTSNCAGHADGEHDSSRQIKTEKL